MSFFFLKIIKDTNSLDVDTQFRALNDRQLLAPLMDSPPTLLWLLNKKSVN